MDRGSSKIFAYFSEEYSAVLGSMKTQTQKPFVIFYETVADNFLLSAVMHICAIHSDFNIWNVNMPTFFPLFLKIRKSSIEKERKICTRTSWFFVRQ